MVGRRLLGLLVPVLVLAFAADANAGPRVYVGIGGPPAFYYRPYAGVRFYYGPGPVYLAPAPVVVVPAQPPTVYVVPAQPVNPVYVPAPAPATKAPTLPPPPPADIPTIPVSPPGK